VSNKFSKIDNFKQVTEKNEEEFAKATIELPINSNGNVLGEIICYIDKMGNIRTPLYNTCDGLYIDTDSQDFNLEEVIENINTKLLGSILEKEEALNTLKNNL
ncbi:MAG: hypothetical protein PHF21_05030, partial [Bacilli bacterium]|nr:hypothetical protein [Bacilli bacterium]